MNYIDLLIVIVYLLVTLAAGLVFGRKTCTIEDYAIGRREFSNSVLAAAICATMISASGTSGLTGKIYSFGAIFVASYFGVVVARLLVAFVVAPKMNPFLGMISCGDVLEKLYGREAKIMMGLLTLLEGSLLAGAQVLATYQAGQYFFGFSKEIGAITTSGIIILYCFRGGIRAITATDVFQFVMMVVAIPIVAAIAIEHIGGFSTFVTALEERRLLTDSLTHGDALKHITIFVSLALTCVIPLTVQRMLMAKNTEQIRKSYLLSGLITFLFYCAIGIVGLAAPLLLPNIDPNLSLPALINELLPIGIRGLVIAGLLSIFMSSSDADMNISSVALTHDILKPLFREKFNDKLLFFFTRLTFVIGGIISTIVALYYSNALDILFLVMVICNSVYFPGLFLGILGLRATTRGFWSGAIMGATIALVLCLIFKVFPLYAMMIAIAANSSVLVLSHVRRSSTSLPSFLKLTQLLLGWMKNLLSHQNTFFELKKSSFAVSGVGYNDVFSTLVLINSVFPFFFKALDFTPLPLSLLICNVISGVMASLILLRQALGAYKFLMPIFWQLMTLTSLSLQTVMLLSYSGFDAVWILDLAVVVALLMTISRKQELVIHAIAAAIMVPVLIHLAPYSPNLDLNSYQYWSFFLHAAALVICLKIFRNRDIAAYRFMTGKFAHETSRSMTSYSTSAHVLNKYLPDLIEAYKSNNNNARNISRDDLVNISNIPKQLLETSARTWKNLKGLLSWMELEFDEPQAETYSIKDTINSAINDNSISPDFRKKIHIKDSVDFYYFGDNTQITQVIINMLENAMHAMNKNPKAQVTIWTSGHSLFIEDNGHGIEKNDLPRIFDDLFSTKGTTGQGLAFSKLVMEKHHGDISCDSKKGHFTRFALNFPDISDRTRGLEHAVNGSRIL